MTAHIPTTTCPACSDLRSLYARNCAALRDARKQRLEALRRVDPAALATFEEEIKQNEAARRIIGHVIEQHDAKHHARAASLPLAA